MGPVLRGANVANNLPIRTMCGIFFITVPIGAILPVVLVEFSAILFRGIRLPVLLVLLLVVPFLLDSHTANLALYSKISFLIMSRNSLLLEDDDISV